VTDGFGKSVTSSFDARFGVPISVTDANQLTSSTTLDAMGRPIKMTPPMTLGLRSAMPSTTSYERCNVLNVSCLPNAVTRVVSSQWGSPQSITYMDSLGRTIRTAAKLLESKYVAPATFGLPGVPQFLDDSDATVTEMNYNARGQILKQYEPSRGGVNANAFTEFEYDALGRAVRKWQRFNRVDQDSLPSDENYRRTEYVYNGLTTNIKVCQVPNKTQVCAGTGTNADGSPQLSMSRTFDSAGKLGHSPISV
jgi:hypothetical protein